jgi:hypothetical protein
MAEGNARSRDWFQILSNIAIFIGLGLVIFELNQSRQIAHAQMTTDLISRIAARNIAIMGEDPRATLARAAIRPGDLDELDAVSLEAFYRQIVNNWSSMYRTSEISGIERPWRATVSAEARAYFTSEPGRRWISAWAANVGVVGGQQQIAEVAEHAVRGESGNHMRSIYELLLSKE